MNLLLVVWSLLYAVQHVLAGKVGVSSTIGLACVSSALKYDFGCPKVYLPLNCPCRNTNFVVTVADCIMKNSKDVSEIAKALKYVRDQCHYWGKQTYTLAEMQEVYNNNSNKVITVDENYKGVLTAPIIIPRDLFEEQHITAKNTSYHYYIGDCFAWGCIGYWGLVIVVAIIANITRTLNPGLYDFIGFKRATWLRKHLTLPALVGDRHLSPWKFYFITLRFPTRGQFLIVLGAVGINIASIVSFLGTKGPTPFLWSSHSDRVLHYLANRTGIIAFGHIPLLVLFACRNNPFIYFTGWPYSTFMVYHRWCARFMGIHAVIHSVAMYWTSFNEHVVLFKWRNVHNWQAGNIAVYMAIFMLIFSLREFRARFYEIFKASHIVMFWIFIVCVVVHCSDYGWLGWIYASFIIYGYEYAARIGRMIISGGVQEAEFSSTEPESNIYRIKIAPGRRRWVPRPGTYVYILILDKDLFWQLHPFSVFQSFSDQEDGTLNFCCKAQDGATRTVLQKVVAANGCFKSNVLIEGPYGHGNHATDYDSVLLFAGGVGFTAMYAYALRLMRRLKSSQHLSMIWVIRNVSNLRAVQREVSYLYSNHGHQCDFRIFITRPGEIEYAWASVGRGENAAEFMKKVGTYVPDTQDEAAMSPTVDPDNQAAIVVDSSAISSNPQLERIDEKDVPEKDSNVIITQNEVEIKDGSKKGLTVVENKVENAKDHEEAEADRTSLKDGLGVVTEREVTKRKTNSSNSSSSNRSSSSSDSDAQLRTIFSNVVDGGLEDTTESPTARKQNSIVFRKPDIQYEVSKFIKEAYGTKSICSCGPPMFVDRIRDGVVRSIFESEERVDYFEDAFSW